MPPARAPPLPRRRHGVPPAPVHAGPTRTAGLLPSSREPLRGRAAGGPLGGGPASRPHQLLAWPGPRGRLPGAPGCVPGDKRAQRRPPRPAPALASPRLCATPPAQAESGGRADHLPSGLQVWGVASVLSPSGLHPPSCPCSERRVQVAPAQTPQPLRCQPFQSPQSPPGQGQAGRPRPQMRLSPFRVRRRGPVLTHPGHP